MSHNITTINGQMPSVSGAMSIDVDPFPSVTTLTSSSTLSVPTSGRSSIIRASSASSITITLPISSNDTVGLRFEIKQVGAGALTLATQGGDTLDGGASHVVDSQNDSRSVVCVASGEWELF